MKTKLFPFAAVFAACAVMFSACEEPVTPAKPEASLEVSAKTLSVESERATATLTFTTNQDWTITASEEWVTVDPASGAASETAISVEVTATDNTVEAERTATILVKAGELEETVTLTQAAKIVYGTEANPWLIMTAEDFVAARKKITPGAETWFKLGADIDMASVENYTPFYLGEDKLEGDAVVTDYTSVYHFDGNGKTISNLTCASDKYPSLFGVLVGSCKDLTVKNAAITAATNGGILAGHAGYESKTATITNVSVQGTVNSQVNRTGGFAGCASNATFTGCSADVAVTTTSTDAAGFVGYVTGKSSFTNCNVKVALVSKALEKCRCGGFIGWNRATETTIENCHVLAGSSIVDDSTRAEAKITSFGGFIGFADSDAEATKLTIKNSSAKANVDSRDWAQVNSTFIGSIGYNPDVLIENCTAEGDVIAGANPQNYAGGLIARAQMAGINGTIAGKVTISNCSYKGNVTGRAGVGGLVGAVDNGELTISNSQVAGTVKNFQNNIGGILGLSTATVKIEGCSFDGKVDGVSYVGGVIGGTGKSPYYEITRTTVKGEVVSSNSYAGGLVGAAQATNEQVVANCICTAAVSTTHASGKQIGGLVGTATSKMSITNSIATGKVSTVTVAGGIIGRIGAADSKVSKCIAWNSEVTATTNSLTGAIIGSLEQGGDYSSCVRKSDMTVTGTSVAVADQDDITTLSATTAYHGKAAAAGKTASAVAKELGWDETIWDLSKDVPALK